MLHYSWHFGFVGCLCISAYSFSPKSTTSLFRGSSNLGHYKLTHKVTRFYFCTQQKQNKLRLKMGGITVWGWLVSLDKKKPVVSPTNDKCSKLGSCQGVLTCMKWSWNSLSPKKFSDSQTHGMKLLEGTTGVCLVVEHPGLLLIH